MSSSRSCMLVVVWSALFQSACATSSPMLVPASELDAEQTFGSYAGRDAAWVSRCRLAVNREFDFGLAVGLPGVGAGIAAGKRKQENRTLAESLTTFARCDMERTLSEAMALCGERCAGLSDSTINLAALLFGSERARLRLVLESARSGRQPIRIVYISDELATAGPKSWSESHAAALWRALVVATQQVVLAYANWSTGSPPTPAVTRYACSGTGGEAIEGRRIGEQGGRIALSSDDGRIVLCSASAL
jgi:hypothetical protein